MATTPTYPNPEAFENAWAQLVAGSWSDPKLKSQLQSDPAGALAGKGVHLPSTVKVKTQDGATGLTVVLPLPDRPAHVAEARLANDDSDDGGVTICSSCCCSC
jgi:hypothetical protein